MLQELFSPTKKKNCIYRTIIRKNVHAVFIMCKYIGMLFICDIILEVHVLSHKITDNFELSTGNRRGQSTFRIQTRTIYSVLVFIQSHHVRESGWLQFAHRHLDFYQGLLHSLEVIPFWKSSITFNGSWNLSRESPYSALYF